tara:strand:+ start:80 stop:868 length:789 start_codon:yes stop_codon:yes gene_type:complete
MKKYFVIGNPIEHSLSPQLHEFWFKKNNLNAFYKKQKLNNIDLSDYILKVRNKEIDGMNVTIPFKKEIISYLDALSAEADKTQSVNTISLSNDKVIGHNTDINGFKFAIKDTKYNATNKKVFILGAGGVVPSIILALIDMNVSNITVTNRTKSKADELKKLFKSIKTVEWGEIPDFDIIINATSLGLKNEEINLDFSKVKNDKFFYDVIYNPNETNFLRNAKIAGNYTENGKKMFIYQAAEAFRIWHGIQPEINEEVFEILG